MSQTPATKAKNRRYRGAKISEYKLRQVVECFARDQSASDAATATKLSKPSVEAIYRRVRERLAEHPIVKFDLGPTPPPEMRAVINRKTQGTAPSALPLHEIAVLTRILNAQHFGGFEELSASNPEHIAKAVKLMKMKVASGRRRYALWEKLASETKDAPPNTRPFDPLRYEPTSAILVNEMKADPRDAHFRYIWKLLLRHPL